MRRSTFGAVTESTKAMLTREVTQLEKDYAKKISEEKIRRDAGALRNSLVRAGWTDTSWGTWGEKWDTSKVLLERVNRIHRLNIKRFHPERIAAGAITSTGAVREDSAWRAGLKAGAEEFGRQSSCLTCAIPFAPCPDKCENTSAQKYGKKIVMLGAVVLIGGIFVYSFAGGLGRGVAGKMARPRPRP